MASSGIAHCLRHGQPISLNDISQTASPDYLQIRSRHGKVSGVSTAIAFSVEGIPRPQPRPRFVKGRVIACADANAKRWIASVEEVARQAQPFSGELGSALSVILVFRFPTKDKTRHGKPHTFRPDADNMAKLILDCMMRAGLTGDDSTVSSLCIRKTWAIDAGVDVLVLEDCRLPVNDALDSLPDWISNGGIAGHGRFDQSQP